MGEQAVVCDSIDALVARVVAAARPGDHVLCMSNGGFGGVHDKLLEALARRAAMTAASPAPVTHLLYLHGFRSSPQSTKARIVGAWMAAHRPDVRVALPAAAALARRRDARLLAATADWPRATTGIVGSSLGGFYATVVAEALGTGCRAVLLNPAIDPARDLAGYIGEITAWHSDERFDFRAEFIDELRAMRPRAHHARRERYLAVIAKGDEVLDWREMSARYAGCQSRAARRQRPCAVGLRRDQLDACCASWAWPDADRPRATIETMFALFEDGGKFHAGRVMSETDASLQVELDSGKRVKVKGVQALLRFEQPAPAELLAEAQRLAADDRPRPGVGVRARREDFGFADAGARVLRRHGRRPAAGRDAARACSTRRTTSAASAGPVQEGARGDGQGGAAGHRTQEAAGASDRGLGRRTRRRSLPGADPRAALQDPLQAGQERGRIQGRRRSRRATRSARRSTCWLPPARSTAPTSSTGAASCSRISRAARLSPRSRRRRSAKSCRSPPARRFRSTTRRRPRSTMRSRCRAWARARSSSASTSPRRRSPSAPTRRSTRSRASACRPSTCRVAS